MSVTSRNRHRQRVPQRLCVARCPFTGIHSADHEFRVKTRRGEWPQAMKAASRGYHSLARTSCALAARRPPHPFEIPLCPNCAAWDQALPFYSWHPTHDLRGDRELLCVPQDAGFPKTCVCCQVHFGRRSALPADAQITQAFFVWRLHTSIAFLTADSPRAATRPHSQKLQFAMR